MKQRLPVFEHIENSNLAVLIPENGWLLMDPSPQAEKLYESNRLT